MSDLELSELDRLLELVIIYNQALNSNGVWTKELQEEYNALKSKIEQKCEKWNNLMEEIKELKEQVEILEIAQKGHDKIIFEYPNLKQRLDKIESKLKEIDSEEGHDVMFCSVEWIEEILRGKEE